MTGETGKRGTARRAVFLDQNRDVKVEAEVGSPLRYYDRQPEPRVPRRRQEWRTFARDAGGCVESIEYAFGEITSGMGGPYGRRGQVSIVLDPPETALDYRNFYATSAVVEIELEDGTVIKRLND